MYAATKSYFCIGEAGYHKQWDSQLFTAKYIN